MKIQVITHDRVRKPIVFVGPSRLSYIFEKQGNKVDFITKKDWLKFYFRYLRFNPEVVISSGVIGFIPALLRKIKLIKCPVVHAWDDIYSEVMGKKYGYGFIYFLEVFTIKNSDYITTVSKHLEKEARKLGKKVSYIPHGADRSNKKAVKLRGRIKVLYVGEQTEYKKVDRIIKAVDGLNCDLYLIGQTNPEFKKIASKNVHFLGFKKQEDVPGYVKAADIVVVTSNQDSALKMFEYIRCGKCILAYDGRIRKILTHKKDAYLTRDFRKALAELIKNKSLRSKLSKNVKKIRTYTWEEVAKSYLNVLSKVIG
ncbi:MAG: glycosyltransferase family 4 protein [Nanoarchaeota archaeon]